MRQSSSQFRYRTDTYRREDFILDVVLLLVLRTDGILVLKNTTQTSRHIGNESRD